MKIGIHFIYIYILCLFICPCQMLYFTVFAFIGVESELWYVRDGELHENALSYRVLVPATVNELPFHWQAHHVMVRYN